MTKPLVHQAKKHFGQNFLQDPHIIRQIVMAIAPSDKDAMIELGPGLGALTCPLLQHTKKLTAIELDREVMAKLRAFCEPYGKLTLIHGDMLKVEWQTILAEHPQARIVGNLPYNISSPILLTLCHYFAAIQDCHFMLQKEVVERLAASPNTKAYGRLSVIMQAHCQIVPLLEVPPSAFTPAPKVTSAVVRLIPKIIKPSAAVCKQLEKITQAAFGQRRKQLRNSLGSLIPPDKLTALGLSLADRAENICVETYLRLAELLAAEIDSK